MKLFLKKCCFCVNLRSACFIMAIIDTCLHAVNLHMCNYVLNKLTIIICLMHAMGSFMLVLSGIIQMSHLIIVYLTTNIVQWLFFIISSYSWFYCQENTQFEISIEAINFCTSIYFWIVAYSYHKLCKSRSLLISDKNFTDI